MFKRKMIYNKINVNPIISSKNSSIFKMIFNIKPVINK